MTVDLTPLQWAAAAGAALPVVVAGVFCGRWLVGRINQRQFDTLALVLSAAAGLKLLWG